MESDSPSSRLQHEQRQQEDLGSGQQARQTRAALDFATAEALLRHDRAATPLPDEIESRLKQSLAAEPASSRPWWKRLLGRRA
jgi:hypothetical protein